MSSSRFLSTFVTVLLGIISLNVTGYYGIKEIKYTQLVDHFGSHNNITKNLTFNQRVYIDDIYWEGVPTSPVFVYFGGEEFLDPGETIDLLTQAARQFHGLVVYIEHRFYGRSVPLGSIGAAMANHDVRACLTVEQALLDFKGIISSVKTNLSMHDSPVIVAGVAYAGVLAVFYRLLYPGMTLGAFASSAPLLLFGNTTQMGGYCSTISQDYEDYSPICHGLINESWSKLDEAASMPDGLQNLSRRFKACGPYPSVESLKQTLASLYMFAAQYDSPKHEMMFGICARIKSNFGGIGGLARALTETIGMGTCFGRYVRGTYSPFEFTSDHTLPWHWQRCNELVFPVGCETNSMTLPLIPFNFTEFTESCKSQFGVVPKPISIPAHFGLKDIKKTLKVHGSNILFSNGLRDPLRNAGILEDISETILAVNTVEGTQRIDVRLPYNEDPTWLKVQRHDELMIIENWIQPFRQANIGFRFRYYYSSPLLYFLLVLFIL